MVALDCKTFVKALTDGFLIDIRNPKQYQAGKIGDAFSLPFSSVNAVDWWAEASIRAGNKPVVVYCRNGKRGLKLAQQLPNKIQFLEGGFEAWEGTMQHDFSTAENLVVIAGYTGSGKTEILEELAKQGAQTIDLEGLANHKGSVFGNLEFQEQPTHDAFQLKVYQAFSVCDKTRPIYVEEEGPFIGKVGLPKALHERLKITQAIDLSMSIDVRKQRIIRLYGAYDRQIFRQAMLGLERRMDVGSFKNALDEFDHGEFESCVAELLHYYDQGYERRRKKAPERSLVLPLHTTGSPTEIAREILAKGKFWAKRDPKR